MTMQSRKHKMSPVTLQSESAMKKISTISDGMIRKVMPEKVCMYESFSLV